jgi:hypothetical protein
MNFRRSLSEVKKSPFLLPSSINIWEEVKNHVQSWKLCGIIISQRPDILIREDITCKRDSAISFSTNQLDVTPDVGTSAAPGGIPRKAMIALLKDTCKALEEKKLSLEAVIAGLELEEEQAEAEENVQVNEEEAGDSAAENTDGSDAF